MDFTLQSLSFYNKFIESYSDKMGTPVGINGEAIAVAFRTEANIFRQRAKTLVNANYPGGLESLTKEIVEATVTAVGGNLTLKEQKSYYRQTRSGYYGDGLGGLPQDLNLINFQERLGGTRLWPQYSFLRNMFVEPRHRGQDIIFHVGSTGKMQPYDKTLPRNFTVYYIQRGWYGRVRKMHPRPRVFNKIIEFGISSNLFAELGRKIMMNSMRTRASIKGQKFNIKTAVQI